ncbi:RING/U-box superfamily protein [Rhynchospora pubera]|uniref:RING/U-box superfamily protein n=1 Tax=Rhynchospora pubera TaxID=906938 RepID=A0AAV8CZH4_9POAL|nr:RING/U-box superfamily protein [Rhynchospora pubera]
MASSVARMPGDDWPGLFPGSHAKHLQKIHLPKISIQSSNQTQFFHPTKPNSNSNSNSNLSEPDLDSEFVSTPSKRHQQHSQKILDRWAVRQAREMVTTIERQAHEAELSALSNTTQPVSDRARQFLYRRQPSPTPSDMSTCSAPAVAYGEVPQTVRASSLIQMWRDLEASTPRCGPGGKQDNVAWGDENEALIARGFMLRPAVRGRGEIEELVARMEAERRREVAFIASRRAVSQFPYRGRLQSILKLRFLLREMPVREETRSPSSKAKFEQLQKSPKKIPTRQSFKLEARHSKNVPATTDESSTNSNVDQTVDSTAESSPRSEFAKQITQSNPCKHDTDVKITKDENQNEENQYEEHILPTNLSTSKNSYCDNEENLNDVATTNNNCHEECTHPPADLAVVNTLSSQVGGDVNPADVAANCLQDKNFSELNSPCSDEQEESRCQSFESSWDERNLWLGSVDWQRSVESTSPISWHGDVLPVEDLGAFPWSSDSPNSWRALVNRDTFENISGNMEIHDLLERKRVTTSLESDFCTKMNRLILSILQRQGQYDDDDNFGEVYTTRPYWRQKYELDNADQIAAASSSLVPYQYHKDSENWQSTTYTNNVSDNSMDVESMAQVRTDMAQMHDEISELRKLVESCIKWQSKLHESIKLEVSNAVSQAVGGQMKVTSNSCSSSEMKSNCGICRICNDAHIDSLLYRCGHMCACFKCARDLQLNNAKCPSCQSPIEDVVRVNPSS